MQLPTARPTDSRTGRRGVPGTCGPPKNSIHRDTNRLVVPILPGPSLRKRRATNACARNVFHRKLIGVGGSSCVTRPFWIETLGVQIQNTSA